MAQSSRLSLLFLFSIILSCDILRLSDNSESVYKLTREIYRPDPLRLRISKDEFDWELNSTLSLQDMPYTCVPECSAGPWSIKRAAAIHRSSCPKWDEYYAVKRKLDADSDNARNASDSDTSTRDRDIATIKALERKRKKARLERRTTGKSAAIDNRSSPKAGPSYTSRDGSDNIANSTSTPFQDSDLPHAGPSHTTYEDSDNLVNHEPDLVNIDMGPIATNTSMNIDSIAPIITTSNTSRNTSDQESTPANTAGQRPQRTRRLPARYKDFLPEGITAILKTSLNSFGLWREYPHKPSYDPDGEVRIEDLSNLPGQSGLDDDDGSQSEPDVASPLNPTQTLLTGWQNNGNPTKSNGEMNSLAHIIQRPDFNIAELQGYSAQAANAKVTKADEDWDYNKLKDSFQEASVDIEVPSGDKNIPSKKFSIPGLLYRTPLSVIRAAFTSPLAKQFHYTPFRLYQKFPTSDSSQDKNSQDENSQNENSQNEKGQRVYTDLYNSDAFLREHSLVQRAPTDDPECKCEKVVAALMCWSDATLLANFGTAKLWPVYMLFGNLSKYIRALPNSGAVNHLAYIPVIPDSIKHDIETFYTKRKADIITHCNRELYHAVWRHLLDDDFIHAYRYGVVIECFDGVKRRIYPRFFTYSADYPEKVLLATIRDLGSCPCPRCLCPKASLDQMGTRQDRTLRTNNLRTFLMGKVKAAREYIYRKGFGIRSARVESLLKATSSVPTMNAFVERLGNDFDVSRMLVPDFMHEFELGVWKAIFTHLIRVLYARDPNLVGLLDHRFRQIPTFGFDTIRLFSNNASEMKRLAARDFEDLLQCSIPVFEGLIDDPAHNKQIMTLLYRAAEWHALAKLRMHTEQTLDYMETRTREFGKIMRDFCALCKEGYDTYETGREQSARTRRASGKATKTNAPASSTSPRRKKLLNLFTYKWHGMMDYVWFIKWTGPTDSYSTQLGELAHRVVKKLYSLGNKKKDPLQIGIHTERRRAQAAMNQGDSISSRFHVGKTNKARNDIRKYTSSGDPAAKHFWPKLQDHLLGRLMEREFDGDTHETFTDEDRKHICIKDRKLVELQTLRVNYTTYNVRRDQDTINPRTHADVMVLSPETEPGAHPYCTSRSGPREMIMLWVRWLGIEPQARSGHQCARLPKVGFVDESDPFAFGFLDPAHVIRGCHLMPAFHDDRTNGLLQTTQPTIARKAGETDDWQLFYVRIFVDRDMFMRYFPGGGVGHLSNREFFQNSEQDDQDDELQVGDEDDELDDFPPETQSVSQALPSGGSLDSGSEESSSEDEQTSLSNESDEDKDESDEESEELDGLNDDDWKWDDGYGSA
ncbi:hypothetical protein EV361DRAFT_871713 [Lentinula raphanica]|nr:hypothetical protein EV361DRAFT_871713 [Lentinula raphanica]